MSEEMSKPLDNLSGPAVRGEAVAQLIPKFAGQFDTHQQWVNKAQSWLSSPDHRRAICVDSLGRRMAIGSDMAMARDEGTFPVRYFWECELAPVAAPVSARAADAHSEPSDDTMPNGLPPISASTYGSKTVCELEQLRRTQRVVPDNLPRWIDNMKGSDPTIDSLIEYIVWQSRAANALDSQPEVKSLGDLLMPKEKRDRILGANASPNSQPTVASQQGSIGDDAIEAAALKHVAVNWKMEPVAGYRTGPYKSTEQFRRLKAFAMELLDSRSTSAPVAPIAADADLQAQLAECVALSQKWASAAGEADGRAEKMREALEAARIGLRDWEIPQNRYKALDKIVAALALSAPQQEGSEAGNGN